MNYTHTFTYVIGYRHSPDRLNTLKRVIDCLVGFGGVQIIIVEQDIHSKLDTLTLKGIKHIFTKSNMPYNRSWAFNVGLKYAKSKVVCFGDSDLIMEPNDFINGLKLLEQYDMVSPYHSVVDLTPQESNIPLEQIVRINRPGRGETDNQKINICGGIALFRKDAITKIGGWSEDFIGWGGEDDFQTIKVHNFLTWHEAKARCFHLHHNRGNIDQDQYGKMLQMLQKMSAWNKDELVKYINGTHPKNGLLNKYDTY